MAAWSAISPDAVAAADSLAYRVVYRVLNAANHGIPQRRERIVFVGFRNDLGDRMVLSRGNPFTRRAALGSNPRRLLGTTRGAKALARNRAAIRRTGAPAGTSDAIALAHGSGRDRRHAGPPSMRQRRPRRWQTTAFSRARAPIPATPDRRSMNPRKLSRPACTAFPAAKTCFSARTEACAISPCERARVCRLFRMILFFMAPGARPCDSWATPCL